jgi:peptide-methionine (S)-S-oxide reductase
VSQSVTHRQSQAFSPVISRQLTFYSLLPDPVMSTMMRTARTTACYLSAFVVVCSAFCTVGPVTTRTNAALWKTSSGLNKHRPDASYHCRPTSGMSTALHMSWLQNFFGGGAYNLKIDYESLDFPGNELAKYAQEGKIPSQSSLPSSLPSLSSSSSSSSSSPNTSSTQQLQLATFAGGCFWGLELAFQRVPGVAYTCVGYSQGTETTPTYDQVCAGNTGHTESVCVYYNPDECSYDDDLLEMFFDRIDPTTVDGQGGDFGRQYRTGVYYHTDAQQLLAQARLAKEQSKYDQRPIATECRAAQLFWPAEPYHQQYLAQGGRFGDRQSAEKGCTDEIQCYG